MKAANVAFVCISRPFVNGIVFSLYFKSLNFDKNGGLHILHNFFRVGSDLWPVSVYPALGLYCSCPSDELDVRVNS